MATIHGTIFHDNGKGLFPFPILEGTASEDTIKGYEGNDIIYGYGGDDNLDGGRHHDRLYGGDGNDTLHGDDGNDNLYGELGDDTIYAGDGNDYLEGGDGFDLLYAGNGDDIMYGGNDSDFLYGESGNDTIYGGNGSDILNSGEGLDTLYGGTDNDTYNVDTVVYVNTGDWLSTSVYDTVIEYQNEGIDTVRASVDGYSLTAHVENLELVGSAIGGSGNDLNNRITGNTLDNELAGGKGNDTLLGYYGNDTLIGYGNGDNEQDILSGGLGSDRFVLGYIGAYYYDNSNSNAVITDFEVGVDKIQVFGHSSNYTFTEYNYALGSSSTLDTGIYYRNDLIAVLQDINKSQIDINRDFDFVDPIPK